VIAVEVGHHHHLHVLRREAAVAKLRSGVLAPLELVVAGEDAPEVVAGVRRDRGVEAGVDQDRPDGRVLDQVDRAREPRVVLARDPDPPRGQHSADAAVLHLEEAGREHGRPAVHRLDHDGGAVGLRTARERPVERHRVGSDLHASSVCSAPDG
jgi:hypothetical protein